MQFRVETDRLFLRTMVTFTAHIAEEPKIASEFSADVYVNHPLL